MKKKIILIGMMGSGKTTIGKILAKKLNLNFIDTDQVVEKKYNLTIKKIFDEFGENFFRLKEEKNILKILQKKTPSVIALGGGAFLNKKIRNIILKDFISIWLNTKLEVIYKRCKNSNKRPLLNNKNKKDLKITIKDIFKTRRTIYSKAKFMVKTNDSPKLICTEIIKKINRFIELKK